MHTHTCLHVRRQQLSETIDSAAPHARKPTGYVFVVAKTQHHVQAVHKSLHCDARMSFVDRHAIDAAPTSESAPGRQSCDDDVESTTAASSPATRRTHRIADEL